MANYAKLVTDGQANPCTSQQEDNALLTALKRGADAGLVDFSRIAVVRTGADFDREAPGESAVAALNLPESGLTLSLLNAHRVGAHLAQSILADWMTWSTGPPKQ